MAGRPLTDQEKARRKCRAMNKKARQAADAENAARRAELGPLFAHQAKVAVAESFTVEQARQSTTWALARRLGGCVPSDATRALDWIEVHKRVRLASGLLSSEQFGVAWAKHQRLVEDRRGVEYLLDNWYQAMKHLPGVQEEALARIREKHLPHQPDDGGAWEAFQKVMGQIRERRET